MKIIDEIGYYGPLLLGITTLILLRSRPTWLVSYIFGYTLNILSILILKLFFRHPRPNQDLSQFYAKENKGFVQYSAYGMPSGHAQSIIFSTVYIFFATKNLWLTLFYIIISCITVYHRLKYNSHNVLQICVGLLLGSFMSWITYFYVKRTIPGILRGKPDDNGPL